MIRRPRRRHPRPPLPADLDAIRSRLRAPAWDQAMEAIEGDDPTTPVEFNRGHSRRPRAGGDEQQTS